MSTSREIESDMSITQNIAKHLLSDRLYESLRGESQTWVMRCPCGAETSVWDMGGVRWKAAGEPQRMGTCRTCQRSFWGQVYRQADRTRQTEDLCATIAMSPQPQTDNYVSMTDLPSEIDLDQTQAILLWIDGVGSWMMYSGEQVTIGGPVEPSSSQPAADLCVLANLRRRHAMLERTGETWRLLMADGGDATYLRDGTEFNLGGNLQMRFRVPSVLSQSAVLRPSAEPWPRMFTGGRTPASIDGVVLMDQVCLLGSGGDAHVPCADWTETVILFRRGRQMWCRSEGNIDIDGHPAVGGACLSNGSVVSGEGWRFRVEAVEAQAS